MGICCISVFPRESACIRLSVQKFVLDLAWASLVVAKYKRQADEHRVIRIKCNKLKSICQVSRTDLSSEKEEQEKAGAGIE